MDVLYKYIPGEHGQAKKATICRRLSRRENYANMWMMECGDTASLNNTPDSFHDTATRLRPLIPRPLHHFPPPLRHHRHHEYSSSSSLSSTTTNGFTLLNLASPATDQSRRDVNGQPAVSSRWNPTPEQLRTLEDLYRRGTRTPTADQIQHITAHLRRYGKIEGKNVFYWFQNHKARERQKRRRQSEEALEVANFRPEIDGPDKDTSYTIWGAGIEKAKNWMLGLRPDDNGLSDKLARWDKELHNTVCGRTLVAAERVQMAGSALLLQRTHYSCSSAETLLFQNPRNALFVRDREGREKKDHEEDGGSEAEATLELFPLKSDPAATMECYQMQQRNIVRNESGGSLMASAVVEEQPNFHGRQFFEFLPLKN